MPDSAVVSLDVGVLLGLAGWMFWTVTPCFSAHFISFSLMNSGP